MNVVIFKLNHLGDNVVFLPVVQEITARFPSWKITLITTPSEASLYAGCLPREAILTCAKSRFDRCWRRPWELAAWLWRIRRLKPDICLISFDQGNIAHFIARHSGAPIRIGANLIHVRFKRTVTHEVPMPADARPAIWHWEMGRALAEAAKEPGWPPTPPPPDLCHLTESGPKPHSRPHVVIHAGSNQPINRWPQERFAALAERLSADCDVTWIERPETLEPGLSPKIHRDAPKDLRALTNLLARADLFLGNNSGPMHVANSLGVPGLVISGASAWGWDPFWHRDRWRVLRDTSLPCVPCGRPDKVVSTCALTEDPLACLHHWSVAAVEAECRAWLARWPTGQSHPQPAAR